MTAGGESHIENQTGFAMDFKSIKLIMKGLNCIMKKRILMATLSMALVVGLAGIVNAATMGSNTIHTPSQVPNASAYVNHNNVSSMNNQIQNMPVNTQIQTMPMSTPMNGQMSNSQNQQGMSGTHRPDQANASSATQQSGQKSSGNTMMGSTGRMGR